MTEATKWTVTSIVCLVIVLAVGTVLRTGFFAVQPIGAIPDGVTIWYWRIGTSMKSVSSGDGISLQATGSVSLLGRITVIGQAMDLIEGRTIARLPYVRGLYLMSTGGREFDK
jgi:hypothetical protein